MSDEVVLRHCAPTLAGIKTGSLFSYAYTSKEVLGQELREQNQMLGTAGLRMVPLKMLPNGRVLVYVYRPCMLGHDLSQPEQEKILRRCGYASMKVADCLRTLKQHLQEMDEFPHEIGLFLGYPPEDVEGFIIHRGRDSKYTGTWKVYGNVDKAKRIFDRYRRCTKAYLEANRRGISLSRLAVHKH